MSTALSFLDAVQGFVEGGSRSSADRPVRLAVVDPAYSPWVSYPSPPPPARVTFEGETVLSGKAYPYASGFIPWAGTRVVLVPIGNSYLITGALSPQTPQGFWQNAAGTESGVELGGGSYYDTDEGLVIAGDVSVSGDLDVDGVGSRQWVWRTSNLTRANATLAADPVLTGINLGVGTYYVEVNLAMTGTTGDFQSRWAFTGTYAGVKGISGPSSSTELQDNGNTMMRTSMHQFNTAVAYGLNSTSVYTVAREWAICTVSVAGVLTLEWAQQTTDATASGLMSGSYIHAERIG